MRQLSFLVIFLCSNAFADGTNSGPMIAVDQMKCAQAVKYVEKYGMYWVSTEMDGPIPIWWIAPVSKIEYCRQREALSAHEVKTRDNPLCLIGYTCHAS